jgi:Cu2+-containing amine oxidase
LPTGPTSTAATSSSGTRSDLTHIPTVEEFPVMTHETVGFAIRPNGFFDENPALDAP